MELSEKTTEKLQKELESLKMVTGMLIGVLIVLFAVIIFGFLTQKDKGVSIGLLVVGFSCSAVLPMQFNNIKKIKKEIASRE